MVKYWLVVSAMVMSDGKSQDDYLFGGANPGGAPKFVEALRFCSISSRHSRFY